MKQMPTTSAVFETTSETVPRNVTIHRVLPSEMRRHLGMKKPASAMMCGLVEEPPDEDAGLVEEAVNSSTENAGPVEEPSAEEMHG